MTASVESPYLLFLGEVKDPRMAKTASGIRYWAEERCLGQLRQDGCKADIGLPDMTVEEAAAQGAKTFVIGTAPIGGDIPDTWLPIIKRALEAGMDIASGMHGDLSSIGDLRCIAQAKNRRLINVRRSGLDYPIGSGRKRTGMRLLTVGTDCGVGKMFAALAIQQELNRRGVKADFRASGQTGILIAGEGICIDAVIGDFMSGAAESLSPDNEADHWDVIEGQGSLHHPSYAGVTLALLHGSQPDVLVLCHDASRTTFVGLDDFAVPSLVDSIETNLAAARLVNRNVRIGGICANTSAMSEADAMKWIRDTQGRLLVPVCDPVRTGVSNIVTDLIQSCAA